MFSLRDLRFVLCSRDLDVLRAQRIMVKPNCTNGKDSRVRLRTNYLSITCCAIKGEGIMSFATNCHLAQLVGLSHAERWILRVL